MNPFVKIAVGFSAVVLVATLLVFWLTTSDDHQVKDLYNNMLSDARTYNADGVTSVLAMNYNYKGYDRQALVRLIKTHVAAGQYDAIEERTSPKFDVQGDNVAFIEAQLDVIRSEMGRRFPIPIKIRIRLEREDTRWHVTAIDYEELRR
jgi:hypothetical protein